MLGARYEEMQCKSALNRVEGMGFRWSLNPYRGCVHGCHYCFARRYHLLYDLSAGGDFTSVIMVKTNVATVLRWELSALKRAYSLYPRPAASTLPRQPVQMALALQDVPVPGPKSLPTYRLTR